MIFRIEKVTNVAVGTVPSPKPPSGRLLETDEEVAPQSEKRCLRFGLRVHPDYREGSNSLVFDEEGLVTAFEFEGLPWQATGQGI